MPHFRNLQPAKRLLDSPAARLSAIECLYLGMPTLWLPASSKYQALVGF
jgi:hypothetical protein